jgi:hypothetical protein
MKNKLIIIGICIWVPIWILSFIPIAAKVLNENFILGLCTAIVMAIGIIIMMVGLLESDYNK